MDETKIQHLIGLIQDQKLRLGQVNGLAFDQVNKTARGGNQQIGATGQTVDLRADRHAANNQANFDMRSLRIGGEIVFNLSSQFARGCQNQTAHGFWSWFFANLQQMIHEWQSKGGGFSGPGLRQPHHITPLEGMGDGLDLNRSWINNTLLLELFHKAGHKAQFFKRHNLSLAPDGAVVADHFDHLGGIAL